MGITREFIQENFGIPEEFISNFTLERFQQLFDGVEETINEQKNMIIALEKCINRKRNRVSTSFLDTVSAIIALRDNKSGGYKLSFNLYDSEPINLGECLLNSFLYEHQVENIVKHPYFSSIVDSDDRYFLLDTCPELYSQDDFVSIGNNFFVIENISQKNIDLIQKELKIPVDCKVDNFGDLLNINVDYIYVFENGYWTTINMIGYNNMVVTPVEKVVSKDTHLRLDFLKFKPSENSITEISDMIEKREQEKKQYRNLVKTPEYWDWVYNIINERSSYSDEEAAYDKDGIDKECGKVLSYFIHYIDYIADMRNIYNYAVDEDNNIINEFERLKYYVRYKDLVFSIILFVGQGAVTVISDVIDDDFNEENIVDLNTIP